jgi:hypothetical protein
MNEDMNEDMPPTATLIALGCVSADGQTATVNAMQQKPSQNLRGRLRVAIAIFSLVICVMTVWVTSLYRVQHTPYSIPVIVDDASKEAVGVKREESLVLYQIALGSAAAVLGLFFAKKDEAHLRLSDYPEMFTASVASMLLVASLACHFAYLTEIGDVYANARRLKADVYADTNQSKIVVALKGAYMSDVRNPEIDYILVLQQRLLVGGAAIACMTLFSAYILKGDEH